MLFDNKLNINDKNIKIDDLNNNLFLEFKKSNIYIDIEGDIELAKDNIDVFDAENDTKITFKHVDDFFYKNYADNNMNNSNIIDVIGIYIKGQKILYTEAKTICEQKFTYLMLPSILFTILTGIINLFIESITGKIITSSLNGATTFILALINFLKLDARAEAHRSSAYKFDKLMTYIEFQSGKQLFFDEEKVKMREVIEHIETTLKEIKETNQFVLPEKIRYNFPILSNINIFSEVKKIQSKEILLMTKLSDILNAIKKIEQNTTKSDGSINENKKTELELKIIEKEHIIHLILTIQNEYTKLDNKIQKEMENYSNRNKYRLRLFDWLKV
jgi:hypothetical protein